MGARRDYQQDERHRPGPPARPLATANTRGQATGDLDALMAMGDVTGRAGAMSAVPNQMWALQSRAGNAAVTALLGRISTGRAAYLQRLPEPVVANAKLANLVGDLYKGAHMKRGKVIGDGSTADAIREEHRTGNATKGVNHDEKGRQYVQALTNWLGKAGPNGGKEASEEDRAAAQALIDDLEDALAS